MRLLLEIRHGKTGGSGLVGSIGFTGQMGCGSKQVNFKQVNQVAGQMGRESKRVNFKQVNQVASRVEFLNCD